MSRGGHARFVRNCAAAPSCSPSRRVQDHVVLLLVLRTQDARAAGAAQAEQLPVENTPCSRRRRSRSASARSVLFAPPLLGIGVVRVADLVEVEAVAGCFGHAGRAGSGEWCTRSRPSARGGSCRRAASARRWSPNSSTGYSSVMGAVASVRSSAGSATSLTRTATSTVGWVTRRCS